MPVGEGHAVFEGGQWNAVVAHVGLLDRVGAAGHTPTPPSPSVRTRERGCLRASTGLPALHRRRGLVTRFPEASRPRGPCRLRGSGEELLLRRRTVLCSVRTLPHGVYDYISQPTPGGYRRSHAYVSCPLPDSPGPAVAGQFVLGHQFD